LKFTCDQPGANAGLIRQRILILARDQFSRPLSLSFDFGGLTESWLVRRRDSLRQAQQAHHSLDRVQTAFDAVCQKVSPDTP
jgi:hypothetical protein